MKEQEYIDVRDLSHVLNALQSLGSVVPGCQPAIDSTDWTNVMGQLQEWQEALFESLEVDEADDD